MRTAWRRKRRAFVRHTREEAPEMNQEKHIETEAFRPPRSEYGRNERPREALH